MRPLTLQFLPDSNRQFTRRDRGSCCPFGFVRSLRIEPLELRQMLAADAGVITGEWIVGFARESDRAVAADEVRTDGSWSVLHSSGRQLTVSTPAGLELEQVRQRFSQAEGVRYVEPNVVVESFGAPNDPNYGLQNHLPLIQAADGWDLAYDASDVVIAIIDSGIDYNHPDLAANMWANPGEIPGNGVDDDLNGWIDDVHGIDPAEGDSDPFPEANSHHGTRVAGVAGAVGNNGVGIAGVAWNTQLMALKHTDADGEVSAAAAVDALNYMTMMKRDYGVNIVVANNSWGTQLQLQSLADAVQDAIDEGIIVVAAAGNSNTNLDAAGATQYYPAVYTQPEVITVSSTDNADNRVFNANYGATTVDIAAPGAVVYSSIISNTPVPGGGTVDYGTSTGTSFAAPQVSAAVALMRSINPQANIAEIKAALLNGADPVAAFAGRSTSEGRLNLPNSLNLIGMWGDFDGDFDLDCDDLDALGDILLAGTHDADFDVTGDGLVDIDDINEWVVGIKKTLPGDANLDFFVDVSDLNIWNANKFTGGRGWCEGDFNADGFADISDLNIWNAHKFQIADQATLQSSVVEVLPVAETALNETEFNGMVQSVMIDASGSSLFSTRAVQPSLNGVGADDVLRTDEQRKAFERAALKREATRSVAARKSSEQSRGQHVDAQRRNSDKSELIVCELSSIEFRSIDLAFAKFMSDDVSLKVPSAAACRRSI